MNAYELADLNDWACCANSKEVSAMLRQQADRIAELEKLTREPTKVFAVPDLMAKAGYFKRTKPLSDEEMKELINNFPIIFSPQDLLSFARAIEERHGIK